MNNSNDCINICLVGCVSAGKSTIINAFFGQEYAQARIRRTTMIPNKFIETSDQRLIDSFDIINQRISLLNEEIYRQTENLANPLNLARYGNELTFHVGKMEMNIINTLNICIYDIPGLNDAKTKKIYYDYLENNFEKFNIILFVVDIMSGLNTADEMDILNLITKNIKKHKEQSNKNISMLTVLNKADYMQIGSNGKLEVLGELGEMYTQTSNTVKQEFTKEKLQAHLLECIPICGLDAHLYRMIKRHRNINMLPREHILRIGVNELGNRFRGYTEAQQMAEVYRIIQNADIDQSIMLSGFGQIENYLNQYITTHGVRMVGENLLLEFGRIPEMKYENMIQILKQKIIVLQKVNQINNTMYNDEMKKVIKQVNTVIYKKINEMNNPYAIKQLYDTELIQRINSDAIIRNAVCPTFLNPNTYPSFFTDRILELVIAEYSEHAVPISKLSYIDLFENIGMFKTEVFDLILDGMMSNPRGTSTFVFDNYGPGFGQRFIKIIDKLKQSDKFIEFLRFFLANMYTTVIKPEELVSKVILFKKYGEIPIYQFLEDFRREKNNINTNTQIKMYIQGIKNNNPNENIIELYYIARCREKSDLDNFINHDKPITIDFNAFI